LLNGNPIASKHFVQRYSSIIEARVRRVLIHAKDKISEDDIKDMVSEIWISLLEDNMRPLRRFNPERHIKVSTWISLLARNKTIDKLRTTHGQMVSIEDVCLEPPSTRPLPLEELERKEDQFLADQAIAELSSEDRQFMKAWYVEDLQPEELAHQFGIAVGTVYSRRFKIQAKLARAIKRLHQAKGRSSCNMLN
jgi:RNA polymerase sigma-70 factor (ECF subfamily)